MVYVALLRGVNVGGNRKVEMAKLKLTFERLGFENVRTFIASGNVVFREDTRTPAQLTEQIEAAIEKDFGFHVDVLLRDLPEIERLIEALPANWVNDKVMKCDVMFLWNHADNPKVIEQLPFNPEIEDVRYYPGVVVWRIDRTHATKSRMFKIVGTPFYKQVTVRNPNTVRKLCKLMIAVAKV